MNLAARPHDPTRRRTLRAAAALAMVASITVLRAAEPEITSFDLVSNEEGLLLSYNINMELSRSVDEALSKAVPLFFVAEADVFRSRFYWRDQRISQAVRRWRIVFQPLTGTYRVTFDGGLSQNYATLSERHYVWLFWVTLAVAALLVVVIAIAALRLIVRVRRGKFGSRLLAKLAAIFALVGVVPGVLIYTVSYQFVSRSIESWFDVKVESALDAGLNLGKSTLDAIVSDVANKTRLAAERIGDTPGSGHPLALQRLREQLAPQDVSVVGPARQTVRA